MFRYQDYENPWAPRIAEQMQRGPQAQADAALRIGDIRARSAEQSGEAWAGGIAGAGQAVAGAIKQANDPSRLLDVEKLKQIKAGQQFNAQVNQLISAVKEPGKPVDRDKLGTIMARSGIPVALQSQTFKTLDEIEGSIQKFQQIRTDHLADIAHAALQDPQAQTPGGFMLLAGLAKSAGLATDDDLAPIGAALADGADPKTLLHSVRSLSEKYKDINKPIVVPRGGTLATPSGDTILKGEAFPPTETELAVRAARGDAEAMAALAKLKPPPNATAEQDDQRYRDIQARASQKQPVSQMEQAWANAYEKQKTLGVDKSAGAAADRQATAISAQTAQQKRSQDFNEAQAGRHELTEKVEQPYRTAVASANTLRDVVASARAGNRVAASLQALETTFSAVRAQGLNRVNMSEIGLPASAGSAWDRLAGWWDKKKEGQPVPPNIQQDMIDFAGILERAAHKRYSEGFADVTKRYGLKDEKPIAGPVADGTPGLLANGTHEVIQNGVRYKVTTDASGKVISSEKVKR